MEDCRDGRRLVQGADCLARIMRGWHAHAHAHASFLMSRDPFLRQISISLTNEDKPLVPLKRDPGLTN